MLRIKPLIAIFPILCLVSGFAQSWVFEWSVPRYYSEYVEYVRFLNPYDGWLATGNGDLLHTVDGGETWQQLSNTDLAWWGWQGMEAFSEDYLVLATASEVISWRNGGRTIQTLLDYAQLGSEVQAMRFSGDSLGILTTEQGKIFQSRYKGLGWAEKTHPLGSVRFSDITFLGRDTAFLLGPEGVLAVCGAQAPACGEEALPDSIRFRRLFGSEARLFGLMSDSTVWRRSKAGVWEKILKGSAYRADIHFPDAQNGFILFEDGLLLSTRNGGTAWDSSRFAKGDYDKVYFLNADTGFVFAQRGVYYKTLDGGAVWSKKGEANHWPQFHGIARMGDGAFVAVGDSGTVLRSTDTGLTWTQIPWDNRDGLSSVKFADGTALITSYQGRVHRSLDNGVSWGLIVEYPWVLRGLEVISASEYWICGSTHEWLSREGVLLHTTDSGASWDTLSPGSSGRFWDFALNDIHFINDSVGFAAADSLCFWRTTDGGIRWEREDMSGWGQPIWDPHYFSVAHADRAVFLSGGSSIVDYSEGDNPISVATFLPIKAVSAWDWDSAVAVGSQSFFVYDPGVSRPSWEQQKMFSLYDLEALADADHRIFLGAGRSGFGCGAIVRFKREPNTVWPSTQVKGNGGRHDGRIMPEGIAVWREPGSRRVFVRLTEPGTGILDVAMLNGRHLISGRRFSGETKFELPNEWRGLFLISVRNGGALHRKSVVNF